jgi:hypothetical protein
VFAVAAAMAAGGVEIRAQGTQPSGPPKSKGRQQLNLTVSSTGGYDIDGPRDANATTPLPGADQAAGYSTMLESGADYGFKGRRLQVRATGGSAQRYLRPLDTLIPSSFGSVNHAGSLAVSNRWARTTLSLNQTALYTSSPLYSFFAPSATETFPDTATPSAAPQASPVYGVKTFKAQSYGSSMMLSHNLTTRTGVAVSADWQRQRTDAVGMTAGTQQMTMYGGGVQMMHRVARNTTATGRVLYRMSDVEYMAPAVNRRLTEEGVEFGLEQRQSLSATRHLTINGLSGVSTMVVPQLMGAAISDRRYTQFWGQMALSYELTRRWRATASYRQGIDYLAGLSEPVSARTVTATTTGQLSRRLDLTASAAYSSGASALNLTNSAFNTYTGDVRLRYSPTPAFATYVQYMYYFYDSGGTLPLVPGIPSHLDRNSIRAGFVVRLPAL